MSMARYLLSSLQERMNMMLTETVQLCKRERCDCNHDVTGSDINYCKLIEDKQEKGKEKLLLIILHRIEKGEINSSHFTRDEAHRALMIYDYLTDAIQDEICDGEGWANDYESEGDLHF